MRLYCMRCEGEQMEILKNETALDSDFLGVIYRCPECKIEINVTIGL